VNRAARRRPLPLRLPLVVMSLTRSRHYNRKQSRASRLDQFALLKCATPLKYLMRVHALGLSNSSHARSRQKSEFYYPPLLSNAPPYPSTRQSHQHIVNGQLNLSPEGKGVRLPRGDDRPRRKKALSGADTPDVQVLLLFRRRSVSREHGDGDGVGVDLNRIAVAVIRVGIWTPNLNGVLTGLV